MAKQPVFTFVLDTDEGTMLFEGSLKSIRQLHNTLDGLIAEYQEHIDDPIPKVKFGNFNMRCGTFKRKPI